MDQYRVIAHRHPKAGEVPHDRPTHVPALVANQHGQLALIHEGKPDFEPMEEGEQRDAIQSVLQEPHHWRRYSGPNQPEWRPGAQVAVSPDGSSYLDDTPPAPPGQGDPGDQGEPGDFAPPGAEADTEHAATAPRQEGEIVTLVGRASVAGVTAGYALPLTACQTCVNFNRALRHVKPCRRPVSEITNRDVDFYASQGGCPFYQFGQHEAEVEEPQSLDTDSNTPKATGRITDEAPDEPDGGDAVDMGKAQPTQPSVAQMAEPQVPDDGNPDTPPPADPFEDSAALRGALIALLGGQVTGKQAPGVALVGEPRRVPGLEAEPPGEDGDEGAEEAPDPMHQSMQHATTVPMSDHGAHSVDESDESALNQWLDRHRLANTDPALEPIYDRVDAMGEGRTDAARALHAHTRERGGTIADALRALDPQFQQRAGGG